MALGTGFIIRDDGLIITNNHVVEQADVIKVQLDEANPKLYEAQVIGRDPRTDIALIKIDAKEKLPVAKLGESKSVQVGEYVAAFGNPYGHAHTMTTGIVSALGREIAEINRFPFIQTDASINPGNSGGPLVDVRGYVIGVNTAIDARAQGIGFAIPIDNVKQIVAQLEKDGRVHRGYIGVGIASVDEDVAQQLGLKEARGTLVTQVLAGSPADKAGIRAYDIITEIDGKKTDDAPSLSNVVGDTPINSTVKVKLWRFDQSGKRSDVSVSLKVADNPDDTKQSSKPAKQYFGAKGAVRSRLQSRELLWRSRARTRHHVGATRPDRHRHRCLFACGQSRPPARRHRDRHQSSRDAQGDRRAEILEKGSQPDSHRARKRDRDRHSRPINQTCSLNSFHSGASERKQLLDSYGLQARSEGARPIEPFGLALD